MVTDIQLECNSQIKINFDGGDLSSDSGLLVIKEFAHKLGFEKLIKKTFKTTDKAARKHKDGENLCQMIYQILADYFNDDDADELSYEPILTSILKKFSLASQPTFSSHSKIVNANRLQLHVLAYNLFNWFRRLVLPENMRKMQIDTIRLKLIKIASRVTRSARYLLFKLCSSCLYQKEFLETLRNIRLIPLLE